MFWSIENVIGFKNGFLKQQLLLKRHLFERTHCDWQWLCGDSLLVIPNRHQRHSGKCKYCKWFSSSSFVPEQRANSIDLGALFHPPSPHSLFCAWINFRKVHIHTPNTHTLYLYLNIIVYPICRRVESRNAANHWLRMEENKLNIWLNCRTNNTAAPGLRVDFPK